MRINKHSIILFLAISLSACGGGGGGSGVAGTSIKPSSIMTKSSLDGLVTVSGKTKPNSTIVITFPNGENQTITADASGNFSLTSRQPQSSGTIEIESSNGTDSATSTSSFIADLTSPSIIKSLYLSTGIMPDLPFTPTLGINSEGPQGGVSSAGMPMPFVDIFRTARPFRESQRMATTDINGNVIYDKDNHIIYTQNSTTYDDNGWPKTVDPNPNYRNVSTTLLQGSLNGSVPEGEYTFLYDGSGTLEFSNSGAVSSVKKITNENKYILDISLKNFDFSGDTTEREREQTISSTNQIFFGIKDISESSYISNIRLIMPGGTCTGNPFIHISEAEAGKCPSGTAYESFVSRLKGNNRNTIIFNPDYLMFLRNFKTIRMMNLMEASSKKLCTAPNTCPSEVKSWAYRAKLDDAVWGGKEQVTIAEKHKGVPAEVIIELANILNRDIWINIPHFSSNEYISNLASIFNRNLKTNKKVYLEYSNEVWNSGFAGGSYMAKKGEDLGLATIPTKQQNYCNTLSTEKRENNSKCHGKYYARVRYFSQHSVEVYKLWEQKFTNKNQLINVLGSYVADPSLTDLMLSYIPEGQTNNIASSIDAVAIAPYFYGCPYRNTEHNFCDGSQKILTEALTVDDIFDIIDQPAKDPNDDSKYYDIKALDGSILMVKNQLKVLKKHNDYSPNNIKLITYEGGQHLVPSVLGKDVTNTEKLRLRKLFDDANRDPRMKERYLKFLNSWRDLSPEGTALFTLYTLPQSYYRYGNFGLKEHLNKPRAESPKFDAVMSFQESVGNCWWDDCSP